MSSQSIGKKFLSLWQGQQNISPTQGQQNIVPIQGQTGEGSGRGTYGYQSPLAKNIHGFFYGFWGKQCPLREGYEGIKGIFERFDDSNKKGYKFWKSNEHFDEDIAQAVDITKRFFDLRNSHFLNNFHLLIYITLRLES